jgi:hypothetical protein
MNFGEAITKAWKIIWKHKILWLFGFLSSCGARGGGSGITNRINSSYQLPNNRNLPQQLPFDLGGLQQAYGKFLQQLDQVPVWLWAVILVIIILFVLLVFLVNLLGQTALVRGAWEADEGVEHLPFNDLCEKAFRRMGKVFLVRLAFILAVLVLVTALSAILVFSSVLTLGVGLLCLALPFACVMIVFSAFFQTWEIQAVIGAAGDDLSFSQAISRSFTLIRQNLVNYLLLYLVLGIGAGILTVLLSLPILLVFFPMLFQALMLNTLRESLTLNAGVIFLIVYIPLLLVANSILEAYIITSWTIAYKRLAHPAVPEGDALLPLESAPVS